MASCVDAERVIASESVRQKARQMILAGETGDILILTEPTAIYQGSKHTRLISLMNDWKEALGGVLPPSSRLWPTPDGLKTTLSSILWPGVIPTSLNRQTTKEESLIYCSWQRPGWAFL